MGAGALFGPALQAIARASGRSGIRARRGPGGRDLGLTASPQDALRRGDGPAAGEAPGRGRGRHAPPFTSAPARRSIRAKTGTGFR